ncbi:MAG: hypothetical protein ACK2UL_05080, partial [Anaerolineae bacterium]
MRATYKAVLVAILLTATVLTTVTLPALPALGAQDDRPASDTGASAAGARGAVVSGADAPGTGATDTGASDTGASDADARGTGASETGASTSDAMSAVTGPRTYPPAAATPRGRSSSCQGEIAGAAQPDAIRLCEEAEVNVQLDTACSVCPGGINVVVIQMKEADDHEWMRDSAYRLVDELTRYTSRQEQDIAVRLGVVQYNHLWSAPRARLTEWLPSARAQLAQVGPATGPEQLQGRFDSAVGDT